MPWRWSRGIGIKLTETLPNDEQVHFVFVPPKTPEDLVKSRAVIKLLARVRFGKPGAAKFTG